MSSLLKKISKLFRNRKKDAGNNKGEGNKNMEKLKDDQNVRRSSINNDYLSLDNQFEIPNERLKRDNLLGSGIFGFIRSGTLQIDDNEENGMKVAIKSVSDEFDPYLVRCIHEEIKLLTSLAPHPNVLTFIGFVRLRSPEIVTELVEGCDLLSFLRSRQSIFQDQIVYSNSTPREKTDQFKNTEMSTDQKSLCTFDLISYAYQIANGMAYLAAVPCDHRVLALLNVSVSHDNTIRIGDFALAGRHSDNENYDCQMANDQLLPILWTAPEVVEKSASSEKTDVFAFAVFLFELFNLGDCKRYCATAAERTPFPEPEFCPPEIFQFMLKCWNDDPTLRPTFTECVTFIGEFLDRHINQLPQQIHDKLLAVSEWQKSIRKQVYERNSNYPAIDVPVIQSE